MIRWVEFGELKEWEARWMEGVTKGKDQAKKEKGVANKEKDGFTQEALGLESSAQWLGEIKRQRQ